MGIMHSSDKTSSFVKDINNDNEKDIHENSNLDNNNEEENVRKEEIHNKITKNRSFTDLSSLPIVISNSIFNGFHKVINIFVIVDEDILYKAAKEGNIIELKKILDSDIWGEQIEYRGTQYTIINIIIKVIIIIINVIIVINFKIKTNGRH